MGCSNCKKKRKSSSRQTFVVRIPIARKISALENRDIIRKLEEYAIELTKDKQV